MKISGLLIHPESNTVNDNLDPNPALRIWVILADQHHMLVYGRKGQRLILLGEGKPTGREVVHRGSAPFNRIYSSCSRFIRHTLEPQTPAGKKAREAFAEGIAAWLCEMQQKDMFDRIIIAAPPKFLGALRKNIPADLLPYIAAEMNKDLMKMDPRKLERELKSILWLPAWT